MSDYFMTGEETLVEPKATIETLEFVDQTNVNSGVKYGYTSTAQFRVTGTDLTAEDLVATSFGVTLTAPATGGTTPTIQAVAVAVAADGLSALVTVKVDTSSTEKLFKVYAVESDDIINNSEDTL